MGLLVSLAALSRDEMVKLVLEQHYHISELTTKVETLQAEEVRLKRDGPRRAALFSKGTRVTAPKKPERKPGQWVFCSRAPPENAM